MGIWKTFERCGYLRAAGELRRLGYYEEAAKLEQQARNLK